MESATSRVLVLVIGVLASNSCRGPDVARAAPRVVETLVRTIAADAEPFALDAAVFGERRRPESWPLRISGLSESTDWEGTVEPLEDRWGIPRPAASSQAIYLSVLCTSADGQRIAFGWQDGDAWRPILARMRAPGHFRVIARGDARYQWLDWPALHPDGSCLVAWAVSADGSRLETWRDGLAVPGPSVSGFEKYWPYWSPDGRSLLVRAIRVAPGAGHSELLLDAMASGAILFEGRRVGPPVFAANGGAWACAVEDTRGAWLRLSTGSMIGPYADIDRPRPTARGFELAARRGTELLRVECEPAGR